MDNKVLFVIGVIILIGIIGLILYKHPSPDTFSRFIQDIEKQKNISGYEIIYDSSNFGLSSETDIIRSNDDWVVHTQYPFANTSSYSSDILCVGRNDKYYCSNVSETDWGVKRIRASEKEVSFPADVENTIKFYTVLRDNGGLEIISSPSRKYANRIANCYHLNLYYDRVPPSELVKIGISPNSQLVLLYKNTTLDLCLDNETGLLLYSNFTFNLDNKTYSQVKEATYMTLQPDESKMTPHVELEHPNVLKPVYLSLVEDLNEYYNCVFKSSDLDRCLYNVSINDKNPDFCDLITDPNTKARCYSVAISFFNDPTLCERMPTQEDKDSCYYLYVYFYGNKTYCKKILNDTIRSDCNSLNVTPVIPSEPECQVDADCVVKGKYGEYCVPIDKNITIDEDKPWKDIYSCYNYTTCGCIDGECRWTPTDEYLSCIDKYEYLEIRQQIERERNSKNQTGE